MTINDTPLVSVIMSVYNAEKYLAQACDSILQQTFQNFEFIIIDDGSKDSSLDIIKEYKKKDKRIIIIKNTKNWGLGFSLNRGIKIANGKYIARQDADDISVKKRLEIQYKFMENNQEIALIGCDNYAIDVNGEIFKHHSIDNFNPEKILKKRLKIFSHGTAFMKSDTLKKLGGYNEDLFYSQDRDLWCRYVLGNKKIARIRLPLYKLRTSVVNNKITKEYGHDRLSNLITFAFISALESGKYNLDLKKIEEITQNIKKNGEKYHYKYPLAYYWFFIARQALIAKKEKKYVRICLKRSLLQKDTYVNHSLKIIFWLLSYIPFNFYYLNRPCFKKLSNFLFSNLQVMIL